MIFKLRCKRSRTSINIYKKNKCLNNYNANLMTSDWIKGLCKDGCLLGCPATRLHDATARKRSHLHTHRRDNYKSERLCMFHKCRFKYLVPVRNVYA
jgi:hypothetical protein